MKKPITTLVVEDEEYVLQAITEMATRLGHNVLRAQDSEEAILAMNAWGQFIQAVLLDWSLPFTFSGRTIIDELTKVDSRIPVIIMSGYPEEEIRPKLPERDGLYFLRKPFFPHDLEVLLHRIHAVPR